MMGTISSCCWLVSTVPLESKFRAAAAGGSAAFSWWDGHSVLPSHHLPLFPGKTSMCSWSRAPWTHSLCEFKLLRGDWEWTAVSWAGVQRSHVQWNRCGWKGSQSLAEAFFLGSQTTAVTKISVGAVPIDICPGAQAARRTFRASGVWDRQYC